jgi:hypothetical protein
MYVHTYFAGPLPDSALRGGRPDENKHAICRHGLGGASQRKGSETYMELQCSARSDVQRADERDGASEWLRRLGKGMLASEERLGFSRDISVGCVVSKSNHLIRLVLGLPGSYARSLNWHRNAFSLP